MKNATSIGIIIGFLLAVGAMWHGILGFFLVLVLCGIGGLIGAHFDGYIDIRNLFNSNGRGHG